MKLLIRVKTLTFLATILSSLSIPTYANYTHYYDGKVKAVHVIEKGTQSVCPVGSCVLIQMTDITNISGTQCDTEGDRYMAFNLENNSGNAMLSIAMTAMISGKKVRAHADGCEGIWTSTTYDASDLNWLKVVN